MLYLEEKNNIFITAITCLLLLFLLIKGTNPIYSGSFNLINDPLESNSNKGIKGLHQYLLIN